MNSSDARGLLLAFAESAEQARELAAAAGLDFAAMDLHHFPDGESRIRLPDTLPAQVFIYRSLDRPNEKLIEVLVAAATARDLGARSLALVAPYLCYMRQDKAFHPGEAVSQRIIGDLLAGAFDQLVTVDPHLHRVHRLEEAVPVKRALALSATDAMSRYLEGRIDEPLLIGPDAESEQWVAAIARRGDLEYHVATKQRLGDRQVRVALPVAAYEGRHVVLVDDVASTGHTLAAACGELAPYRPASITVMVTHALFVNDALQRIEAAGAGQIWSCDSIKHATNRIPLTDCLAQALQQLCIC